MVAVAMGEQNRLELAMVLRDMAEDISGAEAADIDQYRRAAFLAEDIGVAILPAQIEFPDCHALIVRFAKPKGKKKRPKPYFFSL